MLFMEEEVGAKQICEKETSLISQFFKTFTLDLGIVLKNWEIVLKHWEIVFGVCSSLWFISKGS